MASRYRPKSFRDMLLAAALCCCGGTSGSGSGSTSGGAQCQCCGCDVSVWEHFAILSGNCLQCTITITGCGTVVGPYTKPLCRADFLGGDEFTTACDTDDPACGEHQRPNVIRFAYGETGPDTWSDDSNGPQTLNFRSCPPGIDVLSPNHTGPTLEGTASITCCNGVWLFGASLSFPDWAGSGKMRDCVIGYCPVPMLSCSPLIFDDFETTIECTDPFDPEAGFYNCCEDCFGPDRQPACERLTSFEASGGCVVHISISE